MRSSFIPQNFMITHITIFGPGGLRTPNYVGIGMHLVMAVWSNPSPWIIFWIIAYFINQTTFCWWLIKRKMKTFIIIHLNYYYVFSSFKSRKHQNVEWQHNRLLPLLPLYGYQLPGMIWNQKKFKFVFIFSLSNRLCLQKLKVPAYVEARTAHLGNVHVCWMRRIMMMRRN